MQSSFFEVFCTDFVESFWKKNYSPETLLLDINCGVIFTSMITPPGCMKNTTDKIMFFTNAFDQIKVR